MVKEKKTAIEPKEDISKFYTFGTTALPEPSRRAVGSGRYRKIVNDLAKRDTKGWIKIDTKALGHPTKSIYPSLSKVIEAIAKLNGVDTEDRETFKKWRDSNLRLRSIKPDLYVEKLTAKPLNIEEPKIG